MNFQHIDGDIINGAQRDNQYPPGIFRQRSESSNDYSHKDLADLKHFSVRIGSKID